MQWLYLLFLIATIICLGLCDYRWKLAFFYKPKRSLLTIIVCMVILIIWDAAGIMLGIFFSGQSDFTLSYRLAPEFPIEEVFFLFVLSYVTLLFYRFLEVRNKARTI